MPTSRYLKTPDPTEQLIRTVNFNSLSEKEPLLPLAESYVVTVCLFYNDTVASGCVEKKTPSQASEKLAAIILNKYLNSIEVRPFRIVMPSSLPSSQQIQLLCQIETEAISIIEARMLEEGKQQRRNIIIEDVKIARQEADSGSNWSHNWKDDRTSHDFHTGKSLKKLNSILISGR